MPSPWQSLGELISGAGRLDSELALQNATTMNTYRSAQTEQALASAKAEQEKALTSAADRAAAERIRNLQADALRGGQGMGDIVAGNFGNSFMAATQGQGEVQEQGFRKIAGDPNAPLGDVLAAVRGIQGKMGSPIAPVGASGYTDLTDPTHAVKPTPAGTAAVDRANRPVNAPMNPYDRAYQAGLGKGDAEVQLDFPKARLRLAQNDDRVGRMSDTIDNIIGNGELWKAVGLGQPLSSIPSTEANALAADINAFLDQVATSALSEMRESNRTGGAMGNISNRDIELLRNQLGAIKTTMKPEDIRKRLMIARETLLKANQNMHNLFDDLYPTGQSGRQPRQTSGAAPPPKAPPATAPAVEEWVRGPDGKLVRK